MQTAILLSVLAVLTAPVLCTWMNFGQGVYTPRMHSMTAGMTPRLVPQQQFLRWKQCWSYPMPVSMAFVLNDYGSLYLCQSTTPIASGDDSDVTHVRLLKETPCHDYVFVVTNTVGSGGAAVVFATSWQTFYAGGFGSPTPKHGTYVYTSHTKALAYARWVNAAPDCNGFANHYTHDDLAVVATDLVGTKAFSKLEGHYGYPVTSPKAQGEGQTTLCVVVKNPICV